MKFSEKLKQARKNIGITQAQLSERTGINYAAIRKYEIDCNVPRDTHIENLAFALNIPTEALNGVGTNTAKIDTYGKFLASLAKLIQIGFLEPTILLNDDGSKRVHLYLTSPFKELLKAQEPYYCDKIEFDINDKRLNDIFLEWVESYLDLVDCIKEKENQGYIDEMKEEHEKIEFRIFSDTTKITF